jgi:putative ABC transport system permease protein
MAIVVTLSAALTVILAIYLVERNLDETFVRAYPEQAPNLFCVDIQPHQREAFQGVVGHRVTFYPIIRARVSAVNGRPIDRAKERAKKRDNLARIFNLTYRQHLLSDESLQAGQSLFQDAWEGAQVSVLDEVLEMGPMKIGDTLTFKIQGVPLTARIASIRTRRGEAFSPFFYFVFPETVLAKAPQTVFAALRVAPHQVAPLQNRIVAHLPNVSVIDLSATMRTFADLMRRLSKVVRLFSLFSMAAGLLILVSAIVATRALRILESVYYTILGAKRGFVQRIFALESAMIALMSTAVAVLLAQGAALWLCKAVFEIPYRPFWASLVAMAAGTLVVVVAVGFWASRSILEQKPVTYLREQADG